MALRTEPFGTYEGLELLNSFTIINSRSFMDKKYTAASHTSGVMHHGSVQVVRVDQHGPHSGRSIHTLATVDSRSLVQRVTVRDWGVRSLRPARMQRHLVYISRRLSAGTQLSLQLLQGHSVGGQSATCETSS